VEVFVKKKPAAKSKFVKFDTFPTATKPAPTAPLLTPKPPPPLAAPVASAPAKPSH
jgi:hypothetical protein